MQPKDYLRYTVYVTPLALIAAMCFQIGYFTYLDLSLFSILGANEVIIASIQSLPFLILALLGALSLLAFLQLIEKAVAKRTPKTRASEYLSFAYFFLVFSILTFLGTYHMTRGVASAITATLFIVAYFSIVPIAYTKEFKGSAAQFVMIVTAPLILFFLTIFGYFMAHVETAHLLQYHKLSHVRLRTGKTIEASPLRIFPNQSILVSRKGLVVVNTADIERIDFENTGKKLCASESCLKNAWGK
ncbi:MAG: hypothetical protein PVF65_09240 [Sphingomonadales bacterium]|jgi:hypothetical protein